VQDNLALADDLQIPGVTFGLLNNGNWPVTALQYDGILGLTYHAETGFKSVFQEAVDQGLVQQPIFSMYLTKGNHDAGKGGMTHSILIKNNLQDKLLTAPWTIIVHCKLAMYQF
jgi:hypothetical protein